MLMITFSPISTRPSMVAEPICGSSVTLPAFASRTPAALPQPHQFRVARGLVLEHVEAGAADLAGFDQLGQRLLVDHLAARGIDDIGVLAHQFQPPRREQM